MNIDLYLRIVVYDPTSNKEEIEAGYYTDDASEIALKYLNVDGHIKTFEEDIERIKNEMKKENGTYYVDGELSTFEEWQKDRIKWYNELIENNKNSYRKFDNKDVKENIKIPVLAQCRAYCVFEDGKYMIHYYNSLCQYYF